MVEACLLSWPKKKKQSINIATAARTTSAALRPTCHEIVMAWSPDNDAHKSLDRVKQGNVRRCLLLIDRKQKSHYCLEQVRAASVENGSGQLTSERPPS